MYEYLNTLPLTADQKQKVTEAGYENAPTLYMICKVTPVAMKQYLELASLDELETALWNLFTADEKAAVEKELEELKKM